MTWLKATSVSALPLGEMMQVTLGEDDLALYHTEDGYYVTSDVCTHASVSLTTGTLQQCIVACPRHGGRFDVRDGRAVAFPCVIALQTYAVEVRGDDIYIDYEE